MYTRMDDESTEISSALNAYADHVTSGTSSGRIEEGFEIKTQDQASRNSSSSSTRPRDPPEGLADGQEPDEVR
jgi:hypothetical protein